MKREAPWLPVAVLLAMTLSACASTALMAPPDDDAVLEWARRHAIEHCVSFFDGVVGEYEIKMVGSRVRYVGSMDLDSFSPDLRVEMGFDGRLISITSGNAGVFPPDALNQDLKERRCGSFHHFHDDMGRPVKAGWKPYQR